MDGGVRRSLWDVSLASTIKFAPYYCEENVYKLIEILESRRKQTSSHFAALFITSRSGITPVWRQNAGTGPEELVLWDYHVITLDYRYDGTLWVWDVDSTLPCPCPWPLYCEEALRPALVGSNLPRTFRLVMADTLKRTFASDRSHMRDSRGEWTAPPPTWPCIAPASGADPHTLPLFLDPDTDLGAGTCLLEDTNIGRLAHAVRHVTGAQTYVTLPPLQRRRTHEIAVL